jgi:hypothetical protein
MALKKGQRVLSQIEILKAFTPVDRVEKQGVDGRTDAHCND